MLRVGNKGILFKVYRGVPLNFAMTSLVARGCAVGNAGGCWTEILAPHVPPEVPQAPAGSFLLSCRMPLIIPPEVPHCPAGGPFPAPLRNSAPPQDIEAFASRRGALGSHVALPSTSPGCRPLLSTASACRKNPALSEGTSRGHREIG